MCVSIYLYLFQCNFSVIFCFITIRIEEYIKFLANKLLWKPLLSDFLTPKQARKLQATVQVRNYRPLTDSLTGVRCRATSVAKNVCTN